MANLGETAIVARKAIKYGGIALVFLMIGRIVLSASFAYWKKIHPDPPPPPDVLFGKLPKIVFPQAKATSFNYSLETPTGGLPTRLPGQFKVFFMPIKKANLLAYDAAQSIATRLDFILPAKKLSETEYRWDGSVPISSSLTINIITGAFVLDKRWQEDASYTTPNIYYTDSQAIDRVYNLLSRIELLPEDIKTGKPTVLPLKADKDQIVSAVALAQANFLQVNLYRAPVDGVEVVNSQPNKGLITAIIALQREEAKQFISLNYNYYPVDLTRSASYPLIGVAEAYQRLQKGEAFISLVKPNTTNVSIRDVTLQYYDSDIAQQFMQPVYVFRGEPDFTAYVSAVSDAWVE
ncbi:hypothetical protein COT87_00890 [Candidatus Collierbacteria bacterium CG10_big_fil_rev_8_21_14_0_10_44_9]|uniref:Uncharacterized protein n=1 Tax=Candidatus Collierbacteria bacterium CG10_big_fil_rev_8_21_14_0_10_44_9 TaxID=1974535 RepID=A0A2H0VJ89_9BACT|nr:MAG: hypothetical protein COT87_00890 [Candidatus Collierbacteria bacterium CG10_big_fil_rev_8_21_14_0_10_44_9]